MASIPNWKFWFVGFGFLVVDQFVCNIVVFVQTGSISGHNGDPASCSEGIPDCQGHAVDRLPPPVVAARQHRSVILQILTPMPTHQSLVVFLKHSLCTFHGHGSELSNWIL